MEKDQKSDLSYRSEDYVLRLKNLFWELLQVIFRIEISGMENLPAGPSLLIANHNSGAVIESHSLLFALLGRGPKIFGLNHPSLFRVPFFNQHFRKIGAVTASRDVALEVLESNASLLIFPGGNRQAFRPWSQRHQHAFPWAKGWAEIAITAKIPVVPIRFHGSHNVNPIFISNPFVSKLLVLPWVLGVKWFPVSLSQVVLAGLSAVILSTLGLPAIATFVISYFIFCFTPLVPLLPSRIQIQIEPPILPNSHQTSDDLREKMNQVMNHAHRPSGSRRVYPLNALERFMLLHESDELYYKSHFVFDFQGPIDRRRVLATTEKWIQALPQVRSVLQKGFWRSQRYSYDKAWFQAEDLCRFEHGISQERVDQFCQQKFDLYSQPAVRFLFLEEDGRSRVVFSCHHTLFDGAAHAFAFEEWSRLYNGLEANPKFQDLELFRYRSLRKYFGLKECLKMFWEHFRVSPPRMKINVASLVSNPESRSRKVKAHVLHLPPSVSLREDFYAKSFQALHKTLQQLGDEQSPMIAYMPVGLRFLLKIKNSLQNAVVSHTFFVKRSVVSDGTLNEKIKTRLKLDPLRANSKFIFGCLPLCAFGREKTFQEKFASLDQPNAPITSSVLLVSAPIPKKFPVPKDWDQLYISARGTLLKSPSVGLVFTGKPGFETLTIEAVEGLVGEERFQLLLKHIREELGLVETESDSDSDDLNLASMS